MIKGSAEGESDKYSKQSIAEEAVDQLQASEKLIAGKLGLFLPSIRIDW